jgi:hypothetical protein
MLWTGTIRTVSLLTYLGMLAVVMVDAKRRVVVCSGRKLGRIRQKIAVRGSLAGYLYVLRW